MSVFPLQPAPSVTGHGPTGLTLSGQGAGKGTYHIRSPREAEVRNQLHPGRHNVGTASIQGQKQRCRQATYKRGPRYIQKTELDTGIPTT